AGPANSSLKTRPHSVAVAISAMLKLDVGLDQHAVLRPEILLQRLERGDAASGILLAVAAAQAHPADHLAVDYNRKAADEDRKAALEAPLDAECFVPGQSRAVWRLVEQMGRALVAGGGER